MLPIILDMSKRPLVLIGKGAPFENRRRLLREAGAQAVMVNPQHIPEHSIVFIAGLDAAESERWAQAARQAGALVNTEDVLALCDFHMPAQIRRGDLLFTISTGGRSPALSRLLRQDLERRYGAEWAARLDQIAEKRRQWRARKMSAAEISQASQKMIEEEGWICSNS